MNLPQLRSLMVFQFGMFAAIAGLAASSDAKAQDAKFKTFVEAYNAGVAAINGGNLAAARAPLETALKLAKTNRDKIDTQRALLVPYRELQEIEPMQRAGEFIIANSEQAAEQSLTRGAVLSFIHKRGKMEDAVKEYEARLKKTPDDRTLLYLMTEAYAVFLKNPTRSAELGEKLAAIDKQSGKKGDVGGQAQLAQQYVKTGKLKEAAELYEKIAPQDEKTEAWYFKEAANTWLSAKEKAKALEAAKKSVAAKTPEKRSALLTYFWHRALGDIFLETGEPKEAITHYNQALTSTKIEGYLKDTKKKLAQAEAAAKN